MNQQRWITPKAAKDFLLTKCISPLVDKMYESKDFDLDGYMEFFNRKARKSLKKLRPFFVFEKESINQSNGTASNIKEEIILDDFEDGEDHDTNNGNNDESTKESDSVNELPQNFDQECASKKKKKKKQKNQVSFLETDQSNEDCQKVGQKRKCPDDGQKSKKLTKSSENIETEPFIRHESFSLSEATTSDSPPNQFSSDSTNRKSPVHEDTDTILSAGGAGRSSVETESVQLNRPPIKLESITTEMQTEDSVGTNSSVPTSSIPRDITAVGRIIRVERPVTDPQKMFGSTVTRRLQPSVMPEDRASVISEEQEAEDTLEELENVLIFADKENQKTVQSTDSNLPEEAPTDSTVPEDDPSEKNVSTDDHLKLPIALPFFISGFEFSQSFQIKKEPEYHHLPVILWKPQKFTCPHCDCEFALKSTLAYHLRSHAAPTIMHHREEFSCVHCGRSFHLKSTLLYHLKSHKAPTQLHDTFSCSYCGRGFYLESTLLYHLKSHSNPSSEQKQEGAANHQAKGNRKHKCDKCSAVFKSVQALRFHVVSHPDVRPFICYVCSAAFKWKGHLNNHLEYVHSIYDRKNSKPSSAFKGPVTTHSFATRLNTLSCDHCNFMTKLKYRMKAHMKIHVEHPKSCTCKFCY